MEKILLTGGMSAFSQRVAKLFPDDKLVFADSHPIPSPFLQSGKYAAIPPPSKASFAHEILKLCLDHDITMVVLLRKEELIPMAESKLLFAEYGIIVFLPTIDVLQKTMVAINPTSRDCPHIVAVHEKRKILLGDDYHELLGIYSLHGEEQPKLCCLA